MKAVFQLFFLLCILNNTIAQRPPVPNLPFIDQEEAGFNVDSLNALEARIANTEHRDFSPVWWSSKTSKLADRVVLQHLLEKSDP